MMDKAVSSLPRLLNVADITFPREWRLAAHSHSELNEMLLIVRGQVEVEMQGQKLIGRVGRALFYPRGVVHAESALRTAPSHVLYIGWNEAPGTDLSAWPLTAIDRSGRLQQVIRWMLELWP